MINTLEKTYDPLLTFLRVKPSLSSALWRHYPHANIPGAPKKVSL